jgi:hypothetical protein
MTMLKDRPRGEYDGYSYKTANEMTPAERAQVEKKGIEAIKYIKKELGIDLSYILKRA